jgi:hypothetical protein
MRLFCCWLTLFSYGHPPHTLLSGVMILFILLTREEP